MKVRTVKQRNKRFSNKMLEWHKQPPFILLYRSPKLMFVHNMAVLRRFKEELVDLLDDIIDD